MISLLRSCCLTILLLLFLFSLDEYLLKVRDARVDLFLFAINPAIVLVHIIIG